MDWAECTAHDRVSKSSYLKVPVNRTLQTAKTASNISQTRSTLFNGMPKVAITQAGAYKQLLIGLIII